MSEATQDTVKSSRVNAKGMVVIVLLTLLSLGLCAAWMALLASDTIVSHKLSGTEYGLGAAYFATFATAAASIALMFKLLVRKNGN